MSKLAELIKELCPDGVEYKPLDSFATIVRGNGLQKKDFTENGVGCIHYGQIYTYYGTFAYETKSKVSVELAETLKKVETGDLVVAVTSENIEDVCKCVAWLGEETIVTGGHAAIIKHEQNSKYLAYYFQTEDFYKQKVKLVNGTKVMDIAPSKLGKIIIPVPPLPVQCEIVRILDEMAFMNEELEKKLRAELEARQKQYEYYRDALLTFVGGQNASSVCWLKLGDIAVKISSGGTPLKSHSEYYDGDIPWLRTQEVDWNYITDTAIKISAEGLHNSSAKWIPANCVIIAMYGATAAKAAINRIPLTTNQACCNLEIDNSKALYRYVYHWIKKSYLALKSFGQGSQNNINAEIIKQFNIPVPSLEEQQRIVDILDRFDKLCNDLSEGLPAEIAARQKQYEYYRDKLLTFKEKKA